MYRVTENYLAAQLAGERPVVLAFIQSRMGLRVYGAGTPTVAQIGSYGGIIIYDGSTSIGDSSIYGSQTIILDKAARAISFGSLSETMSPEGDNILAGFAGQSEISQLSVTLNNIKGHFSDVLQEENFLTKTLRLRQGYALLGYSDFINLFSGKITELSLSDIELRITAQSA